MGRDRARWGAGYHLGEMVTAMDDQETDRSIDELLSYEPAPEDGLTRYRREALETEARRKAAQVPTTSQLNAQRTKDWERWLRARLDAERLSVFDAVAESLARLDERLTALEKQQRGLDDGDVLDLLPSSSTIRKVRIA